MYLKTAQPHLVLLLALTLTSLSIIGYAISTQNFSKKMDTIISTNFTIDLIIALIILTDMLVLKTPFFSS